MTLNKLKKGQRAKVEGFAQGFEGQALMLGIGLLPGDEVTLIGESFLGSPLTFQTTAGDSLALRTYQAQYINVEIIK